MSIDYSEKKIKKAAKMLGLSFDDTYVLAADRGLKSLEKDDMESFLRKSIQMQAIQITLASDNNLTLLRYWIRSLADAGQLEPDM